MPTTRSLKRSITWRAVPRFGSILLLCVLFALSAVAASGEEPSPVPVASMWEGWLDGAAGMFKAIDRMGSQNKPVAVYFYTDWCPYCRQFENGLLSKPEVQDYMKDLICVRINPETGPEEAEMAQLYGVRGFPAFFIHSNQSKVLTQVNRMTLKGGRPVLMEGPDFVETLKRAASR